MARARTVPVLIMSAFAPELAPLADWLRSPGRGRLATRIACVPVGIGAIDAAAGAAAAIARWQPVVTLFVGTAGSYRSTLPIGSAAVARRVCLASGEVLRGQAYLPRPLRTRISTDSSLQRQLLRAGPAHLADVATTLGITRTRSLGTRIAEGTDSTVENLEVFAVARAAERARVRFGAVLGIANRVGPAAHQQWLAHQDEATVAACDVIQSWLASR